MRYICKYKKNAKCFCQSEGDTNSFQNYDFGGICICTNQCTTISGSGKAFQFYAPNPGISLIIKPGFSIAITPGAKSIQMHKWNQMPNASLNGRTFVREVPHTGGNVVLDIDLTYKWISVFAKNPSNNNNFDGCCFVVNGNTITLLGYS